ncbi:MAG: hypothetical protein NE330_23205 [Lentisphaeraceae bacterium]|nr:hypothetical protein [Lentisphaeraceae bacterium]
MPSKTIMIVLSSLLLLFGNHLTAADKIQKQVSKEIAKLQKSKKPSISKGTLRNGTLANSIELATPEG